MKKKFILAIFGISLLFMACQEDSYYNDYDMGGKNSSILTEAMKLIEDNHDFVSLPDLDKTVKGSSVTRGGSNKSLRYEEEDFIFDWGEADVMKSKLAEVVIAPVRYNKEMALRTITLEGNSRKRETTSLHSILYMRKMLETGQTHAYILSFAPDRDYINACEENGEELQLYPNPQGSDFSGILFFSTIYGEITHGIRYENGRKCYYILPRSDRNREFIEKYRNGHYCDHECDSTHTHVKMSLEFITATATTRSTYSNNSEDNGGLLCSICKKNVYECTCVEIVECGVCRKQPCICDEYIEEEEEEDRCNDCGLPVQWCGCGSSWNDSDGTSGPNPGGYQPNYPPSNPPGDNSGGSSGNDGNSNQSQELTPTEIFIEIGKANATMTKEDLIKLQESIHKWYNTNDYNKSILNKLMEVNPNVTFGINPEVNVARFYPDDNLLVFYSTDEFTYPNIGEELIHLTQYHVFYHNASNTKRGELEGKAIYDIISVWTNTGYPLNASYHGNGMSADYINWIMDKNYEDYDEKFEEWIKYYTYGGSYSGDSFEYKMFDWFKNLLK